MSVLRQFSACARPCCASSIATAADGARIVADFLRAPRRLLMRSRSVASTFEPHALQFLDVVFHRLRGVAR